MRLAVKPKRTSWGSICNASGASCIMSDRAVNTILHVDNLSQCMLSHSKLGSLLPLVSRRGELKVWKLFRWSNKTETAEPYAVTLHIKRLARS
jgi:hypothetical protein